MKRATSWKSVLAPGDGDPRHGMNGYSNLGCRCEICRSANVGYNQRARARRAEALRSGEVARPHGKYSTYVNYGCRCDECRAANTERDRRLRESRGGS